MGENVRIRRCSGNATAVRLGFSLCSVGGLVMRGRARFPLVMALWGLLAAGCASSEGPLQLTILHTNDFHSRIQPISRFDGPCPDDDAKAGKCFGGAARIAFKVAQERQAVAAAGGQALLLDAGDQFQGTLFFTRYKGEAERQTMNAIGYQAMTIGNHEFDEGPAVLKRFVDGLHFPAVSANIDAAAEPALAGAIAPYTIVKVGEHRIGIIGLTTDETPTISSPGPSLRFTSPEIAARGAVAALTAQGVDKIVALTHLGLAKDRELAATVDGIDIIVGGHSHTVLSNTQAGAEGPYPVRVKSPSGVEVPIVQAGSYGRYLGRLDVAFNAEGQVTAAKGDLILLDQSVAEDEGVKATVARLAQPLEELRRQVVGESAVDIDQTKCRQAECLMGNLVADALRWSLKAQGTEIVLQNGGGLRASIGKGPITMGDVLTVLPFQNTIATLGLKGRDLVAALENGVRQPNGGPFPQVSGLRFVWDAGRSPGNRVVSVEVQGPDGKFQRLDPDRVYKVATNNFMRRGGDGYTSLRDGAIDPYDAGDNVENAVIAYIKAHAPVRVALDRRIQRR